MKRLWRPALACVLALLALGLWADIRWGVFSPPRYRLPVLIYHHFVEEDGDADTGTVVSARRLREQLAALRDAGYTAVSLAQVLDFVDQGTPLPEKSVLITIDDGYTSNLDIAAPILEELGMRATVFVIGINEGEDCYVHTGQPFALPRFSYGEAVPWVERGVLDLQCHTFDLHRLPPDGEREGVLPLSGEGDYDQVLLEDLAQFRQRREGRVSTPLVALAYPFGYWCAQADQILAQEGIRLTFTTREHRNTLYAGHPETLRLLGRYNVTQAVSGPALVARLNRP